MQKRSEYKRYTRSRASNVLYFTFLTAMGLFSILPFFYSVVTSFKPLDELLVFPPKFWVERPTLSNYALLPSLINKLEVPLSRYAFNSLFTTFAATILHIIAATAAAFAFSKSKIKCRNVLFWIVQLSLLYNAYTLAVPQYLVFSKLGLIDTFWIYILPAIPSSVGVFLMKQYMESSIPDALLEAARIDGAGAFQMFFKIVIPITKPAWMTLFLLSFQSQWSYTPGGTIFSEELKTLPYVLTSISAGGIARSGSTMAATVIMMIPPILIYFVTQSNVMETMSTAGMKG